MRPRRPFMPCVPGAAGGFREFLISLCVASGGALLDLDRMSDEQALNTLAQGEQVLAAVEFNPAEIADMTPRVPRPVGDAARSSSAGCARAGGEGHVALPQWRSDHGTDVHDPPVC